MPDSISELRLDPARALDDLALAWIRYPKEIRKELGDEMRMLLKMGREKIAEHYDRRDADSIARGPGFYYSGHERIERKHTAAALKYSLNMGMGGDFGLSFNMRAMFYFYGASKGCRGPSDSPAFVEYFQEYGYTARGGTHVPGKGMLQSGWNEVAPDMLNALDMAIEVAIARVG